MSRHVISERSQWYVQKGSRVQGPFTCEEVGRFLLLGRVRNTDRVSRDGELWEPVTQVPELIPEALLDMDSGAGWARFLEARNAFDERGADRDRAAKGATVTVGGPDGERRDTRGDPLERMRRDWRARPEGGADAGSSSLSRVRAVWLPWTLLGITLGALGAVLWLNAVGASGG